VEEIKDFLFRLRTDKKFNFQPQGQWEKIKAFVDVKYLEERLNTLIHDLNNPKRIEAHHWSYMPKHWQIVAWLCLKCHKEEHSHKSPRFPPPTVIDVDPSVDPAFFNKEV